MCLSKGLGAPVGSILAGSSEFINRSRRVRKLLGGGMRQAGIIAAPGLLALENVERLQKDHENANRLAAGLGELPSLTVPEPETNIVLVETEDPADEFLDRCTDVGVKGGAFDDHLVRFATHMDINHADIETAIERITESEGGR